MGKMMECDEVIGGGSALRVCSDGMRFGRELARYQILRYSWHCGMDGQKAIHE